MNEKNTFPFKSVLNLRPLIDFWNRTLKSPEASWGLSPEELTSKLDDAKEFLDPITDFSALERHQGLIKTLMSAVFPRASWEIQLSGAFIPFQLRPFFVSPLLKKKIIGGDGSLKGKPFPDPDTYNRKLLLRAYLMILKKFYEIDSNQESALTIVIPDSDTGLDTYYNLLIQDKFVTCHSLSDPPELTEADRREIQESLSDINVLSRIIPIEKFEFQGFSVVHAEDVTSEAVISNLEKEIAGNCPFRKATGLALLETRLRTLLGVPDLRVGVMAVDRDQCMVFKDLGVEDRENIFLPPIRFNISEVDGTHFQNVLNDGRTIIVSDQSTAPIKLKSNIDLMEKDAKSLLLAALKYGEGPIGLLYMTSEHSMEFQILHSGLIEKVVPILSIALKNEIDVINSEIERAILDNCSAVHRSILWRFKQMAIDSLEKSREGLIAEFDPVVFRDIFALHATADIRGASIGRNRSIQTDLAKQLNLALEIVSAAVSKKSFPILDEASHQIRGRLRRISEGFTTADEQPIINLIQSEIEPLFPFLRTFGPELAKAIDEYENSLDPKTLTVFDERRDLEESISLLNNTLSDYLEKEQAHAQSIFPHFFDKRKTDGVDYVMYLGESMVEKLKFNEVYVKNLRLWQLIVCCGMAWHNSVVQPKLKAPLELSHVVVVSHTPISIRFRFDQKRFDVESSPDIGHEIIRSRVSGATTKIDNDKLSQPDKIAIVYSRPEEAIEMKRHISYLQDNHYLMDDLEYVELNELEGIQWLRARRVSVNVQSDELSKRISEIERRSS
ncbi:MAG: hypothetical protein V1897_07105 [Pseudomonadota bacterium]